MENVSVRPLVIWLLRYKYNGWLDVKLQATYLIWLSLFWLGVATTAILSPWSPVHMWPFSAATALHLKYVYSREMVACAKSHPAVGESSRVNSEQKSPIGKCSESLSFHFFEAILISVWQLCMPAACIVKVFVFIVYFFFFFKVQFAVKICLVSTEGRSFLLFCEVTVIFELRNLCQFSPIFEFCNDQS